MRAKHVQKPMQTLCDKRLNYHSLMQKTILRAFFYGFLYVVLLHVIGRLRLI